MLKGLFVCLRHTRAVSHGFPAQSLCPMWIPASSLGRGVRLGQHQTPVPRNQESPGHGLQLLCLAQSSPGALDLKPPLQTRGKEWKNPWLDRWRGCVLLLHGPAWSCRPDWQAAVTHPAHPSMCPGQHCRHAPLTVVLWLGLSPQLVTCSWLFRVRKQERAPRTLCTLEPAKSNLRAMGLQAGTKGERPRTQWEQPVPSP